MELKTIGYIGFQDIIRIRGNHITHVFIVAKCLEIVRSNEGEFGFKSQYFDGISD